MGHDLFESLKSPAKIAIRDRSLPARPKIEVKAGNSLESRDSKSFPGPAPKKVPLDRRAESTRDRQTKARVIFLRLRPLNCYLFEGEETAEALDANEITPPLQTKL